MPESLEDVNKPRTVLYPQQAYILNQFFETNHSPTNAEYNILALQTGLERKWILNWFSRKRTRRRRTGAPIPAPVPLYTKGVLQGLQKKFNDGAESLGDQVLLAHANIVLKAAQIANSTVERQGNSATSAPQVPCANICAKKVEPNSNTTFTGDHTVSSPTTYGPVVRVRASLLQGLVNNFCKTATEPADDTAMPNTHPPDSKSLESPDALPISTSSPLEQMEKEGSPVFSVDPPARKTHGVGSIPLVAPRPIPLQVVNAQELDDAIVKMQMPDLTQADDRDAFDLSGLPDFDEAHPAIFCHSPSPNTAEAPLDIEALLALFDTAGQIPTTDIAPSDHGSAFVVDDAFAFLMSENLAQDKSFQAAMDLVSLPGIEFQW